jgi:hypothetical protein
MLGSRERNRRRHMHYMVASGNGFMPTGIASKIGGKEGKPVSRFCAALLEHGAYIVLALQVPHSRAHLVSGGQKLQSDMTANKT